MARVPQVGRPHPLLVFCCFRPSYPFTAPLPQASIYSLTPGLVDSAPVSKGRFVSGPETATEAPTMTHVVTIEGPGPRVAEFGFLIRPGAMP